MIKSFSQQFPINLITNIISFLLSVGINIFMTPFYLHQVGIEGLGLLRLALTFPMYTSLVTVFLTGSVSRYLVIALQEKNKQKANMVLSTSFFVLMTLIIFLIPVILLISFNAELFFNFPQRYSGEVTYLFLAVFATSLLSLISSIFMIPAQAYNRLDISNTIQIISTIVQTSLIVLLLHFFTAMVSVVGLAFFMVAILGLIMSIVVWRKLSPELEIHKRNFDKITFHEIASTGSWLIVNHFGSLLFLYTDLWVVNYFYGAGGTGEYSIGLQWNNMLRMMAGVFAGLIAPMIMISYAHKNFLKLQTLSFMGVKFIGLILAIPIGIITGFAVPFLNLWLGKEFSHLAPLLWIMLFPLVINLAVMPLFSINTAYNQIKIPGIVTVMMGIVNLGLAILFSHYLNFGIYGVAVAGAIVLTMKNTVFIPLYTAKMMQIRTLTFIKKMLPGTLLTLFTFLAAYMISLTCNIETWSSLLEYIAMILVVAMVLIWFFFLDDQERYFFRQTFLKKKKNSVITGNAN
jgi:membrane protein EpsK